MADALASGASVHKDLGLQVPFAHKIVGQVLPRKSTGGQWSPFEAGVVLLGRFSEANSRLTATCRRGHRPPAEFVGVRLPAAGGLGRFLVGGEHQDCERPLVRSRMGVVQDLVRLRFGSLAFRDSGSTRCWAGFSRIVDLRHR